MHVTGESGRKAVEQGVKVEGHDEVKGDGVFCVVGNRSYGGDGYVVPFGVKYHGYVESICSDVVSRSGRETAVGGG